MEKAEAEGSIDMTRKSSRMNGQRDERSPPLVLGPLGVGHAASEGEVVAELEVRQLCARKKGHPEEDRVSAWPTTRHSEERSSIASGQDPSLMLALVARSVNRLAMRSPKSTATATGTKNADPLRSGDQVIRGNPASRGTKASAEVLVVPPGG